MINALLFGAGYEPDSAPPSAIDLALHLGIRVRFVQGLRKRTGKTSRRALRRKYHWIEVDRDLSPVRRHFRVATELAEILLETRPELSDDRPADETPEQLRKRATRLATEILMPIRNLRAAVRHHGTDLQAIHHQFPGVSLEALGFGLLRVRRCIFTVLAEGKVVARVASRGVSPGRRLSPEENLAAGRAYAEGRPEVLRGEEGTVRAWPVAGRDRVLLVMDLEDVENSEDESTVELE